MSPPGPRRRDASPASPASLGGADRGERKSPAPTPAATMRAGGIERSSPCPAPSRSRASSIRLPGRARRRTTT